MRNLYDARKQASVQRARRWSAAQSFGPKASDIDAAAEERRWRTAGWRTVDGRRGITRGQRPIDRSAAASYRRSAASRRRREWSPAAAVHCDRRTDASKHTERDALRLREEEEDTSRMNRAGKGEWIAVGDVR